MSKQEFINTVGTLARNEYLSRDKWILPSVCIAQAILESGWNLNAKSLFGIKGTGFTATSSEFYRGNMVEIQASFRCYPNVASAVVGYYNFLSQTDRYRNALNNPEYENVVYSLIHTVDGKPYATDPSYIDKIISLIEQYKLTTYDERPQQKTTKEIALEVIAGEWGDGQDRLRKLSDYGYNYRVVQDEVNAILQKKNNSRLSLDEIANQVIAGKFGNGNERKTKINELGYEYNEVQKLVNQKLGR